MSGNLWRPVRQSAVFLAVIVLMQACATPEGGVGAQPDAGVDSRKAKVQKPQKPVDTGAQTEAQVMAAVNEQNSIFFANAEVEIDGVGRAKLQAVAERLKADEKLVARLTGYTDDFGSPSYNLALSIQRAEVVYKALRSMGVPSLQLRYTGVGAEKVSYSCRSPECRRKMRRVEITY